MKLENVALKMKQYYGNRKYSIRYLLDKGHANKYSCSLIKEITLFNTKNIFSIY